MDKRRLFAGLACLALGLVLFFVPQEAVPWLPGPQAAGAGLGLSGLMFLARAFASRRNAPITGRDFDVAPRETPAGGRRRRRKKS